MNVLYLFTSFLFFVWIIRNILFWVNLWQTKEYRLDRLVAHLKETSQGRKLIFAPLNIVKLFAIITYPYVIFFEGLLPLYAIIVFCIYFGEFGDFFQAIVKRQVKRPKLTGKAGLLVVSTFFLITVLYSVGIVQQGFLWLLILDKLLPFFIAFFVFFLSFPTILIQDYRIDQAIRKLSKFPHITVIGITGSFGKSSTKEYVAQILSKKFQVVKTKGTNNTPIGLANTVLSSINGKIEIFVAEMGAYKRGEIAQLCEIVRPKIGVITAVGTQHLSLFGSLENLAKTKYELIDSLPFDGLGLFNVNNSGALELYKKTKKKKIAYGSTSDKKNTHSLKKDIVASDIHVEKDGVSFTVSGQNKRFSCKAPLLGSHVVENVLPGIFLALHFGMTEGGIKDAIASLTPLPHTMVPHTSIQQVKLIDDTFNVNPDGVIAAMEYARIYTGKKILVLEPMIELGSVAKIEHYRVGKAIANICDYIFLTKGNFLEDIQKGIKDAKGLCQIEVAQPVKIADFINNQANKSDVVIFEGKEALLVMNKIL